MAAGSMNLQGIVGRLGASQRMQKTTCEPIGRATGFVRERQARNSHTGHPYQHASHVTFPATDLAWLRLRRTANSHGFVAPKIEIC